MKDQDKDTFMTNASFENSSFLRVPFHTLKAKEKEITIIKNKAILNRKFFITIILLAIIYFISWSLLKKSPDAFKKPMDIKAIAMLSIASILIATHLFLSIKRLLRVIANFTLEKKESLYVNDVLITPTADDKRISVIIQNVSGQGGIGGSYTIGIGFGKKFRGLCYELDELDAKKVADFISTHLELPVENREAVAFPLFKLH